MASGSWADIVRGEAANNIRPVEKEMKPERTIDLVPELELIKRFEVHQSLTLTEACEMAEVREDLEIPEIYRGVRSIPAVTQVSKLRGRRGVVPYQEWIRRVETAPGTFQILESLDPQVTIRQILKTFRDNWGIVRSLYSYMHQYDRWDIRFVYNLFSDGRELISCGGKDPALMRAIALKACFSDQPFPFEYMRYLPGASSDRTLMVEHNGWETQLKYVKLDSLKKAGDKVVYVFERIPSSLSLNDLMVRVEKRGWVHYPMAGFSTHVHFSDFKYDDETHLGFELECLRGLRIYARAIKVNRPCYTARIVPFSFPLVRASNVLCFYVGLVLLRINSFTNFGQVYGIFKEVIGNQDRAACLSQVNYLCQCARDFDPSFDAIMTSIQTMLEDDRIPILESLYSQFELSRCTFNPFILYSWSWDDLREVSPDGAIVQRP